MKFWSCNKVLFCCCIIKPITKPICDQFDDIFGLNKLFVCFLDTYLYILVLVMAEDIKQFLYGWLGKSKITPNYDVTTVGNAGRQRFRCEVT